MVGWYHSRFCWYHIKYLLIDINNRHDNSPLSSAKQQTLICFVLPQQKYMLLLIGCLIMLSCFPMEMKQWNLCVEIH